MSAIDELAAATAHVAATAGPATVRIGRAGGRGTGVVLADGRVLTNAHNVRGPQVTVGFADGRSTRGEVAGIDAEGDLAVISVDTAGAPAIAWAGGDTPGIGAPVWALAQPEGAGVRVTAGAVSAVGRAFRGPGGRPISGGIEHTAPLARGSSGGPLVDAGGRLVGCNTHRLDDGFYLAIPAGAELRERVEALGRGETPTRYHLGVAIAPAGVARRMRAAVGLPERDGVLVRAVEDGSPADRAGLRRGDLIVAAAGTPLEGPADLFAALDRVPADGTLTVTALRGVDEVTVEVRFVEDAAAG
jgi:serine protease Do